MAQQFVQARRIGGVPVRDVSASSLDGESSDLMRADARLATPDAVARLRKPPTPPPPPFVDDMPDRLFMASADEMPPDAQPAPEAEAESAPKRGRRRGPKPGISKWTRRVDKEVVDLQRDQSLLIKQLPFMRMVKTISTAFSGVDESGEPLLNWELDALNALHEATEAHLVDLFRDASDSARVSKRKTLQREDMQLARKLRGAPQ